VPSSVRRIGTALPDREMQVYDHRMKQLVAVDWSKVDKPFDQVRAPLKQLGASAAAAAGDFLIPEYTPISDQGRAGSCVANASSDAFEILDGIAHGPAAVKQLSRLWLYFISRQYHGATKVDDGTYPRAALHQLQTVGTFEEKYFPYYDDPDHVTGADSIPELDCYMLASNNRINGFYHLDVNSPTFLDDVETAVRALHPVIFAIPVGQEYESYSGGGIILQPPVTTLGGHCNVITGVRYPNGQRTFWTRNSWTAQWGDQGHGLLSESYMSWATDAWVATTTVQAVR
jgi:C1A family cysteine protease